MIEIPNFSIVIIKESYFLSRPELMIEANTQSNRIYLGLNFHIHGKNFVIPFESNLYKSVQLEKISQYPLPISSRPNAGINFEKCLIINDVEDIKEIIPLDESKIANEQKNEIKNNELDIITRFNYYINNFIKSCNKGREKKEFIFKYSTLHFFKDELLS